MAWSVASQRSLPVTLAEALASSARIVWQCDVCRAYGRADLVAMIAALGPDFVLLDRKPACRVCPGKVTFLDASHVFWRRLETFTDRDAVWWAYQDRERARLNALGWRVIAGKWTAPRSTASDG